MRNARTPSRNFAWAQARNPVHDALATLKDFASRFGKSAGLPAPAGRPPLPISQPGIRSALQACRTAFWSLALFSGMSNILMLTGSFFMLQVYDRVLPSRSVPTLIGLGILAVMLYAFQGALDLIRGRINLRVGRFLDQTLSLQIYEGIVRTPLKTRSDGDGLQPLRDLDQVRSFLSSGGPSAIFDLPWMPFYVALCFVFHFWLGVTALVGAIVLIAVTMLTEFRTREPTRTAAGHARARTALAVAGRRNAEVLRAMGMIGRTAQVWNKANRDYLAAHEKASDVAGSLGGISKVLRMILQSGVLAVGAYLVIHQEATGGIIIASSILASRALAPVELAIANWKGLVGARQAAQRLHQLLTTFPLEHAPMALPEPKESLSVENVSIAPPGAQRFVVSEASFSMKGGQGLGVIGPSGSGKSSLARALVGVWTPARGKVRIDGAALEQWSSETLGRHIGYLPQDVELFDGSVASNIARFEPEPDSRAVVAAAQVAGVHKLVLSLPEGYGTVIGEGGMTLSAGQRQRIALARALYGNPFFVVLDEPSSNLDAEGEQALTQAIMSVRARGGIVIVVAHRPSALAAVDHVLVMGEGRVQAFGPKDAVLRTVLQPAAPAPAPVSAQLKKLADAFGAVG